MTETIKKDLNCKLIKDISEVMSNLDIYDFCYGLKRKYEINDFNCENIKNILYSDNGSNVLYCFFDEIKENKHLEYLIESSVIETNTQEKIKNSILVELKKMIDSKENVKQKNNRGIER